MECWGECLKRGSRSASHVAPCGIDRERLRGKTTSERKGVGRAKTRLRKAYVAAQIRRG